MKKIIIIIAGIVGLYIISSNYPGNHIYGILILIFLIYISYSKNINNILLGLNRNNNFNLNKTNCQFKITLDIIKILNHDEIEKYFKSNAFDENNNLHKKIISNGKKLLKDGIIKNNVTFNIKNDNIYIDGKIKFEDIFYHEIFIPYELKDYDINVSHFSQSGITIRIIILNGNLKLQIGDFRANLNNKIYSENLGNMDFDTYKNFYDLISIPIIYKLYYLNISKKYLNIIAKGIEGYYNENGKTWNDEWKKQRQTLHADLKKYYYLNSYSEDDTIDDKWSKYSEEFNNKSEEILNQQKITIKDYSDDYWSQKNLGYINDISNEYISIEIANLNTWFENYQENTCGYIKEEFMP